MIDTIFEAQRAELVRELRALSDLSGTPSGDVVRRAANAIEDDSFLAGQMRLVISHLRYAAATIPDKSEYWAGLVAKICSVKKGAN